MSKPIIRYRIFLTLITVVISAGLIMANHQLPPVYQLLAWGVAIGLMSTFCYILFSWFFDVSLILFVPIIPMIGTALRYSFGFGFGYPNDNSFWIGEGIGIAIMIATAIVVPLRKLTRPAVSQRRQMPPMEDTSPHKLILPRASELHPDN
mgnify:CR=1 FL=1